jgi:hypothetical protein
MHAATCHDKTLLSATIRATIHHPGFSDILSLIYSAFVSLNLMYNSFYMQYPAKRFNLQLSTAKYR